MNEKSTEEIIIYSRLPLAVCREISAHLQQVEGVKTALIPQSSTKFDYNESQIEAIQIRYPIDLSSQEKQYLEAILDYYSKKHENYQLEIMLTPKD